MKKLAKIQLAVVGVLTTITLNAQAFESPWQARRAISTEPTSVALPYANTSNPRWEIYRKEQSGGDYDSREFAFNYRDTRVTVEPRITACYSGNCDTYSNLSPKYNRVRLLAQKCLDKVEDYIFKLSLGQNEVSKTMPLLRAMRWAYKDHSTYTSLMFDVQASMDRDGSNPRLRSLLVRTNHHNGGTSVRIDENGDCDVDQAVENYVQAIKNSTVNGHGTGYSDDEYGAPVAQ